MALFSFPVLPSLSRHKGVTGQKRAGMQRRVKCAELCIVPMFLGAKLRFSLSYKGNKTRPPCFECTLQLKKQVGEIEPLETADCEEVPLHPSSMQR